MVGDPDTDGDGNPDSTDPNPNTPTAANDTGAGNPSVGTAVAILANDDYLDNGAANNAGITTITDAGTGTAAGTVGIDNTTGEITYTPTGGEAGTTVTIDYQVCNDASGSAVCATASLSFAVGNPDTDGDGNPDSTDPNPSTPVAANDTGAGNPSVGTAVAILANDDYLANGAANNAGITTITDAGTGTAAGTVGIDNTTGEITYTPTAGEAGTTVSIDYQVCNDASGSAVCATASLSFAVGNPDTDGDGNPDSTDPNPSTPVAANDTGAGNPSVGTAVAILANDDYLDNGDPNNAGITTITDAGTGTAAGTVAINNTTGEITYTPTGGEAGTTVSIDYQVCNDASGSAVCATATLSFMVGDPDTDGDGNPDSTDPNPNTPTAANDTGAGNPTVGTAVAILANDDYLANGAANNAGITTITDAGTGTAAGTVGIDNTTGEITYTPTAGEAGTTVSIDYQVCNDASGSAVCATASLSFAVGNPDTDGDGNPDSTDPNPNTPTAANDTGAGNPTVGTAVAILANDDYLANGAANNAGITTITDAGTGTAAGTVGIDNTTGEITYTPTAGEAGTTVSIDYQVCNDASGSAVCATASLSFAVGNPDTDGDGNPDSTDPNPSTPVAANDTGAGNPSVGTAVAILANDDYLANGAANNAGITTITDAGTGTAAGTVGIDNTTGEITYTPTAGEAGTTVSIDYQVCNDASGSAVCATATLSFMVGNPDTDGDGNPDSIDPNPSTPTAANDTGVGNPSAGTAVAILANDDYLANGAA